MSDQVSMRDPLSKGENRILESFSYDDQIVRWFVIATVVWGVVALFLGTTIAFQLAHWKVNGLGDLPYFCRYLLLHAKTFKNQTL
jgi:cbb3-type cytochrome oxidase subunit 1